MAVEEHFLSWKTATTCMEALYQGSKQANFKGPKFFETADAARASLLLSPQCHSSLLGVSPKHDISNMCTELVELFRLSGRQDAIDINGMLARLARLARLCLPRECQRTSSTSSFARIHKE